jgi:hypothetical protein
MVTSPKANILSALVILNRSNAFPKTPRSDVVVELSFEDFAIVILRGAIWFRALDLGIKTITGRKRDNWWISLKSTFGMRDSDSSKKSFASRSIESRANSATWVFITDAVELPRFRAPRLRKPVKNRWVIAFFLGSFIV